MYIDLENDQRELLLQIYLLLFTKQSAQIKNVIYSLNIFTYISNIVKRWNSQKYIGWFKGLNEQFIWYIDLENDQRELMVQKYLLLFTKQS